MIFVSLYTWMRGVQHVVAMGMVFHGRITRAETILASSLSLSLAFGSGHWSRVGAYAYEYAHSALPATGVVSLLLHTHGPLFLTL